MNALEIERVQHDDRTISTFENSLWYILLGFVEILNGLLRIVTLGQLSTNLTLAVLFTKMSREADRRGDTNE